MVLGIAHNFYSPATGDHFVALGNGLGGVIGAFRMHVRSDLANDRANIRFRENNHGIDIGQGGQNFGAFIGRHQGAAFTFQRADGSIGVDGHNQFPTQLFGGAQIAHMSDVQQIEAAIGQSYGIAGAAPFRNLLLQFIACENLFCDCLVLEAVPVPARGASMRISLSPRGARSFSALHPGLAPWATFFRRFAAWQFAV